MIDSAIIVQMVEENIGQHTGIRTMGCIQQEWELQVNKCQCGRHSYRRNKGLEYTI